jgi:two-component system, NtrC family, response regulator HydG
MRRGDKTPPQPGSRRPLVQAGQLKNDSSRFPDIADLAAELHFSPVDGHIWLNDQRMLLIHSRAMGELRRELIESLGVDRARGLLTRMGYAAGTSDAVTARKVRPKMSPHDMFSVGPQLHALEGIVQVEPVRLDFDLASGKYYGEFIWKGSVEDEENVRHQGIGAEPACWMQIGYASGFTSEFMGRPVFYREVECSSMGHHQCRIVGKPVEEWDDAEDELRFLRAEPFSQGLAAKSSKRPGSTSELSAPAPAPAFAEVDIQIVGVSPGFNSVCHMVRRVASTHATVLFLGESGVGKEVFARALHQVSPRRKQPFIALNCAAIPEQLVESELFGVEKGAYTGAQASRLGRFERASGGTLFLDEIGILDLVAQGKLLRALQEGEIERLGDDRSRKVDVRVVAATNLDLRAEVSAGRFREDLFYRLNVFPIIIPPLRERREDLPILINHFIERYSQRHNRRVSGFTSRAIEALLTYGWPGNIRELENMIERGVILATDGMPIDVGHLFTSGEKFAERFDVGKRGELTPAKRLQAAAASQAETDVGLITERLCALLLDQPESGSDSAAQNVSLDDIETVLLKKAVEQSQGNLSAAARRLGITRPQLAYRLKQRGIAHDGE